MLVDQGICITPVFLGPVKLVLVSNRIGSDIMPRLTSRFERYNEFNIRVYDVTATTNFPTIELGKVNEFNIRVFNDFARNATYYIILVLKYRHT